MKKNKTWLDEFKLALFLDDIGSFEKLLNRIEYNQSELVQIRALLIEAIKLVKHKKDLQAVEIQKCRRALKYVKS
ncbi:MULTISPECIES: hypothetical protein [unclassified Campylobacter]|uniref:hypothetical protein n=1 Tax=unclassified Campylobacter TaxID=2593542 RepID=UPI001237DDED|nr:MULTISPECIES: hypothetical protein [unclassified Campylobacter]KAA6225377.1 hypothetical protein FMM54_06330 [Campylobacter sp. LR185c]KAA6227073.1 hypothetical protein FMM55_03725 [Campylobacter sp. LR196d]KAA6227644.1 hypothetical protein FMM57_04270 [Campylobacter sp. LR286c]KAA6229509.1 hypothetical protein FMM56_08145 [Campylobacter sp. LR264d]KAA6230753.1 hypothetical protein FMM58_04900 [Campylobacter sp. LR291e]